jgi:hypothetical protein
MAYQAHRVDDGFYDRYYRPEAVWPLKGEPGVVPT